MALTNPIFAKTRAINPLFMSSGKIFPGFKGGFEGGEIEKKENL